MPTEWEIYAWEPESQSLLHAQTEEGSADSDEDEIQLGRGNHTLSPERQTTPARATGNELGREPGEDSLAHDTVPRSKLPEKGGNAMEGLTKPAGSHGSQPSAHR